MEAVLTKEEDKPEGVLRNDQVVSNKKKNGVRFWDVDIKPEESEMAEHSPLSIEERISADHVDDLGEFRLTCIYVYDYLEVFVDIAKGLAASDPYILISLLSKDNKCFQMSKTYSKNKFTITSFLESFKYHIEKSDFHLFTLWLSVWDSNPKGKDDFLGEIKIPLSSVDLNQRIWYGLNHKDSSELQIPTLYHGMLHVKLLFSPTTTTEAVADTTRGALHVTIDKAKHLPQVGPNGRTNSYVRMQILPNKTRKGLRKTKVKRNKLNPVWEEEFTYKDITWGELKSARALDICVKNRKRLFKDGVLGCLKLGLSMDSNSEEVGHWEAMLKEPGTCVECWHSLITSTNIPHLSSPDREQSISPESSSSPLINKNANNQPIEGTQANPQPPAPTIETMNKSTQKDKTNQALALSQPSSNTPKLTIPTKPTSYFSQKSEERETNPPLAKLSQSSSSSPPIPTTPTLGLKIQGSMNCDSLACASFPISKRSSADHVDGPGEFRLTCIYVYDYLEVFVDIAKGLEASDPYILISLLSKDNKCFQMSKTYSKNKFTITSFLESFKYHIEKSDFHLFTLWLSVWDSNPKEKDDFLGEIKIPLSCVDLNQRIWYGLNHKDSSELQIPTTYHGMLHVKLLFSPTTTTEAVADTTRGALHVTIDKAKHLPQVGPNGRTNSYVKMQLLPNKTRKGLRKTKVKRNKLNPVWEEEFTYKDITWGELKSARALDICVKNRKRLFKDGVLGCIELGLSMDSNSEEVGHWEAMLKEPGTCVECWHSLITSTNIPHLSSPDREQSISPESSSSPIINNNQSIEDTLATPQPPALTIEIMNKSTQKDKTNQALAVSQPSSNTLTLTIPTKPTSYFSPKSEERETNSPLAKLSQSSSSSPPVTTTPTLGLKLQGSMNCDNLACASSPISKTMLKDYSETGEVLVSVQHINKHFSVFINKVRGLAHADQDKSPNPYIRASIISEIYKYPKKRTETKRNTRNPVYRQTFQYYVEQSCIGLCTLQLCVWDWERFGEDELLGEINIPLSNINLEDVDGFWFKLQKEKEIAVKDSSISGQLPLRLNRTKKAPINLKSSILHEPNINNNTNQTNSPMITK